MTTPFRTKAEAEKAAEGRPLAGPVYISPVQAAAENVPVGWYVAFPRNIDARLYDAE